MNKGTKTLTLVDSTSLVPASLERIGRMVGREKLPMPDPADSEERWLEYCQQDVLVLAELVLTVMDWWDANRLGHWSLSGPACGWNAMRHKAKPRFCVIKTEPEGVAWDRLAVRGGRRDVTRVGQIPGGPFALVDFENAYLTVAATQLLPKGRMAWRDSFDVDSPMINGNRFGVIANCVVDTPEPLYPLRTSRGVFYPVGAFQTVLASPEIVEARERNHLVSVGSGFVHDMGFPLKGWAEWCLGLLAAGTDETPSVVQAMVKQWGRSVIGKFAARSSRQVDLGPALWPSWHIERGTHGVDHTPAVDVHIAGRHWWEIGDQESDNAYPALLAWVESYVRVALGRMLSEMGEDMWVCCDTDGAVLDLTKARSWLGLRGLPLRGAPGPMRVAQAVCSAVEHLTWPLVPRVKLLSETLEVSGPQHYAGDTFERMAGRPGKPEVEGDGRLRWWAWPGVKWQMEHGHRDGFVRMEQSWTSPSQLAHRWVLESGVAVPVRAGFGADGKSVLLPAAHGSPGGVAWWLAANQAPSLAGLF